MKLISTKEVCEIFGVSDRTIFNWRKKNSKFPKPFNFGGENKYSQDEIKEFINLHRVTD
jgi:predicted DNA-binding transcriptional regulator AlpA